MGLLGRPRRAAFDQHTIKFTVGIIALSLPCLEMYLTGGRINSISESYWTEFAFGPWPRNIFVGLLFAIAALMLSYNGLEEREMWLGKLGAVCATLIPMFPCGCGGRPEIVDRLHFGAAGVMFAILGVFCFIFWRRAERKWLAHGNHRARLRMNIYRLCCTGTIAAIGCFIYSFVFHVERYLLYGEIAGLVAFGVSWLTASRVIWFLTLPHERKALIRKTTRSVTTPSSTMTTPVSARLHPPRPSSQDHISVPPVTAWKNDSGG